MDKALSQAKEGLPCQSTRRPIVLLAAALETSRLILRTMLELNDVEVVEAGDEEAAVDAALHERLDLILMDLNLPQLGDLTALRRIRACAGARQVPIVVLTNYASDNSRSTTFDAGCNELLVKPISGYAFYRTLRRYLFPINADGVQSNCAISVITAGVVWQGRERVAVSSAG